MNSNVYFENIKTNFGTWIISIKLCKDKSVEWAFANNKFDLRYKAIDCHGNKYNAIKHIINSLKQEDTIIIMDEHWCTHIIDMVMYANFPVTVPTCKNCMFYEPSLSGQPSVCSKCNISLKGIDIDGKCDCDFWKQDEMI